MDRTRRATLSVAIITLNEEANLDRTLASVAWADECVVLDSGSTDGTAAVSAARRVRFVTERWRGFAPQKNRALDLCSSDWILSLDADEVVTPELAASIQQVLAGEATDTVYAIARRNHFLGRWMRHGGYYPDRKLRLLRRGMARFRDTPVHETLVTSCRITDLPGDLVHNAYPSLSAYLEHMERYSTLGADIAVSRGRTGKHWPGFLNGVIFNPLATFAYNYGLRLGFLDGREGLLLHLYHSCYVSWKYAKAWERARRRP